MKNGDDKTVAEELLKTLSERKRKFEVVHEAITEGFLTKEEALSLYKIKEIDYLKWLNKN